MRETVFFAIVCAAVAGHAAEPVNLALGKPYTFSTTPAYRYCTDPGDSAQLTDGRHSCTNDGRSFWIHRETVGWNRPQGGAQMITVDLGRSCAISGFAYTLAAGCADVSWPAAIGVYVSEDKASWICAGDLWARSTSRTGAPKFDSYSVYRAFDDAMPCRGRYVAFLHFASGMGFCDEVEVFAGDEKTSNPSDARVVVNPFADKFRMQLHGFLASDAVRLGVAPPKMEVPDGMKAGELRTELPLSAKHAALWAKNAPRLRSAGFASPVFWKSNRWGHLDPLAIPAKDSVADAPLEVEMMRGETRSETINILNPTDNPIDFKVMVEGLPESAHVDCREVLFTIGIGANGQWFGTASSALRPGRGASVAVTVPAGVSKQVWISFVRPSGVPGTFRGVVRAVGGNATLSCPIVLKLHDLDFPRRPRIHVGGWDYLDKLVRGGKSPQLVAAHKREMLSMFTDTPWGSQAVFPKKAYFDKEGNLTNALDFAELDAWIALWPEARQFAAFYCAMPNVKVFGEEAGTPRFAKMVASYFRAWHEHAREASGGREIIVCTQDEPSTPASARNSVLWNTAIRAGVPGLKVFTDPVYEKAEAVPQDLVEATDILCPFRPFFAKKDDQREAWCRMAAPGTGRELNLYSCLVGSRGLDPEGYYRGQFWDAFRMGATGSFFWQFGCGAGSGSFVAFGQSHPECSPYFAGTTAADVMSGKQSEGVREGVEDHELLTLLRDAANAIRAKGGDTREIDEFLANAVSRAVDEKETTDERFERTHSRFDVVRIEALRLLSSNMPSD